MMTKKWALGLALVSVTAIGSAVALAKPEGGRFEQSHHGGGGFHGRGFGRILLQLDLNEKQEDMALDLRKTVRKEVRAFRRASVERLDELAAELAKPTPDVQKVYSLADQRLDAAKKSLHEAIDQYMKLHATFTPAQREQLASHIKRAQTRALKFMDD